MDQGVPELWETTGTAGRNANGAKDNALLQVDLSALGEWEQILQMSFSTTICFVIRITTGRKKKIYHSSYMLHGQKLG